MCRSSLPILCALLLIAACSDSTGPADAAFAVTVQVRDPGGQPVAGLRASLSPDVDGVQWPHGDPAAKPQTSIVVDLPEPGIWTLRIADVAGAAVYARTFESVGGPVGLIWDGLDNDGQRMHDGWYEVQLSTVREGETEPSVVTAPLLLISGTPDSFTCGVTDAEGRFSVSDRTFVPAFWDVPPIPTRDDQGNVLDEIVITTATRLVLLDDEGRAMTHVFDAVDGPQTISLIWDR
ncbi:MAG: FlgD immunoglobulin-like domain containing protein [Candidatus Krumholzibacteriia bacterium]